MSSLRKFLVCSCTITVHGIRMYDSNFQKSSAAPLLNIEDDNYYGRESFHIEDSNAELSSHPKPKVEKLFQSCLQSCSILLRKIFYCCHDKTSDDDEDDDTNDWMERQTGATTVDNHCILHSI